MVNRRPEAAERRIVDDVDQVRDAGCAVLHLHVEGFQVLAALGDTKALGEPQHLVDTDAAGGDLAGVLDEGARLGAEHVVDTGVEVW